MIAAAVPTGTHREAAASSPTRVRPSWPAPILGVGICTSFITGWMTVGRVLTDRVALAAAFIGLAAAISCTLASWLARRRRRQPSSARFAAAFLILVCGTTVMSALFMGLEAAWTSHPLIELPLQVALLVLAIQSAQALYGFLSIAAFLLLPFGLPLMVLTALAIARAR